MPIQKAKNKKLVFISFLSILLGNFLFASVTNATTNVWVLTGMPANVWRVPDLWLGASLDGVHFKNIKPASPTYNYLSAFDIYGFENDDGGFVSDGYDTFNWSEATNTITAVNDGGHTTTIYAPVIISEQTGSVYKLTVDFTKTSGETPHLYLSDEDNFNITCPTLQSGPTPNTFYYTVPDDIDWGAYGKLIFQNDNAANWSAQVSFTLETYYSPVYTGRGGRHVIDSNIMYYNNKFYLVYHQHNYYSDYADTIATSTDLLNWTDLVNIPVGDGGTKGTDPNAPMWFWDNTGVLHIITAMDGHRYTEVHPNNSSDSTTWNNASNWSSPVVIIDHNSQVIDAQDPSMLFVNNVYNLLYSVSGAVGPYWRTSTSSILTGWSDATDLRTKVIHSGAGFSNNFIEQYGLTLLDDNTIRLYWGNSKQIYYNNSLAPSDFNNWSTSAPIVYQALPFNIGWGRPIRFTDSSVVAYVESLINPSITSITSDKANGSYTTGETININLIFSEPVTGNGVVHLNSGGSCSFSASAFSTASCVYTVQSGNNSTQLNASSISGTLTDQYDYTITDFNPAANFSGKNIIIDTANPTVNISSITADSTSQLTITSQTAIDSESGLHANPYQFQETSENIGATSSGWQTSTTFTDTGLSSNTRYTYKVRAKDAVGNISSYSSTLSKYTLAPTPTNLTGTVHRDNTTLTVDTLNNQTSGSSGYYFYRSDNPTLYNSDWIRTNTWQDTNIICGTSYTYYVKYRNGDETGTSAISLTQPSVPCGSNATVPATQSPQQNQTTEPQTTDTIAQLTQRINEIKTQIQNLLSQIQTLSQTTISSPNTFHFTKNLRLGTIDEEVRQLQKFLNSHGFKISDQGPGSPNKETNIFGPLTRDTVIRFQEYYQTSILSPLNLIRGTGVVAYYTRVKLNELLSK